MHVCVCVCITSELLLLVFVIFALSDSLPDPLELLLMIPGTSKYELKTIASIKGIVSIKCIFIGNQALNPI